MKAHHFANVEAMVAALQPGYPVYCLSPSALREAAAIFLGGFPGKVLYAVKCNPHPLVLDSLYKAGIRHFDTASLPEVALASELGADVAAHFMHPVKSRTAIVTAYAVYGVRHFIVDHPDELAKIVEETGGAKDLVVMVRLATPGGVARYELSRKFGATPEDAASLLQAVEAIGWETGLGFHVGSQCLSPESYRKGLHLAKEIAARAGVPLRYLDVGGGFPADYIGENAPPLEEYFAVIRQGLAEIDLPEGCEVLCQPGRALIANGCKLVVQVQLRKKDAIYINDGIYHSLSEAVTGQIRLPVRLLRHRERPAEAMQDFTVYGPTCDSTDLLPYPFRLPVDTREGDWIEIGMIGAYSNALASHFNGFHPNTFVTVG